jgi:hypothetical protein
MAKKKPNITGTPNTGNEEIPPGATSKAADRAIHTGGGPAGSGAGPRHAAADPGSPDEEFEAVDSNDPAADGTLADPDAPIEEESEAYASPEGGAVEERRLISGRPEVAKKKVNDAQTVWHSDFADGTCATGRMSVVSPGASRVS